MLFERYDDVVKKDTIKKAGTILKAYKELYNESLEKSVSGIKKNYDLESVEKDLSESFFRLKTGLNNIWENSGFDYLGNKSVKEFFHGINDPDLLKEIVFEYSIECDEEMPGALLEKVYSNGYEYIGDLVFTMMDLSHASNRDQGFLIPVWGMKLSGLWKIKEAPIKILDFLDEVIKDESEEKYLYLETAMETLREIGKESIIPILARLNEGNDHSEMNEYLALTLAHIGNENKSEAIYSCLKKMFNNNNNKYIFAECLGLYGDGRAIPALRGYLIKNIKDLGMDTKYALKLSIERLGGKVDDIFLS